MVKVFNRNPKSESLCIIHFVTLQSEKAIYLATEYVEPLEKYLERRENPQGDLSVAWGLFQVTVSETIIEK